MQEIPCELQVCVRKRATKYWSLLQKMTYTDKASSASLPLCITCSHCTTLQHTWIPRLPHHEKKMINHFRHFSIILSQKIFFFRDAASHTYNLHVWHDQSGREKWEKKGCACEEVISHMQSSRVTQVHVYMYTFIYTHIHTCFLMRRASMMARNTSGISVCLIRFGPVLFLCTCVSVDMHVPKTIHIYIQIYKHIHVFIYDVIIYVRVYEVFHAHTYRCTYIYVNKLLPKKVHVCINTLTHTWVQTLTEKWIQKNEYIQKYTYVQMQ